ncbi:Protein of unknown function [Pyronema omphalodes CBS 100304]|uniref:Uncharacterized protein n=1 Tax=Pyronema omphalodes (strain CBS 100304) TaxID=1076935 RepID=U4LFT8_PYROM|nr:Protein of unknown function [Pyronema omphalodes CBS 100304]
MPVSIALGVFEVRRVLRAPISLLGGTEKKLLLPMALGRLNASEAHDG